MAAKPQLIEEKNGIASRLAELLVGQSEAVNTITPFIQMYQSGLSPDGRPIGVILMLGPTGTGKTRTVEALAEVLHGSSKNLLRVDCGEFQNSHEIGKLAIQISDLKRSPLSVHQGLTRVSRILGWQHSKRSSRQSL